jgi:hypothetical protein
VFVANRFINARAIGILLGGSDICQAVVIEKPGIAVTRTQYLERNALRSGSAASADPASEIML